MTDPKPMSVEDLLPDLPGYDPEPADGVRVGESPVPGLTLKRVLRGHAGAIGRIAWSADGRFLASPSEDTSIRIWDIAQGLCTNVLVGHTDIVTSVAWSPDGRRLASTGCDITIRLWDTTSGLQSQVLTGFSSNEYGTTSRTNTGVVPKVLWSALRSYYNYKLRSYNRPNNVERSSRVSQPNRGHFGLICSVSWSPNGQHLVSASEDRTIRLWDATSGQLLQTWRGHTDAVTNTAWSPDGQYLASVSDDQTIRIWNAKNGQQWQTWTEHNHFINSISWSSDGRYLASASDDQTIRIWNAKNGKVSQILEGHSDSPKCVVFSKKVRWLASKGDKTVRLWRCDTWTCVAVLKESDSEKWITSCAFHPENSVLATLCEKDNGIRIWELNEEILLGQAVSDSVRYTTAKLVLVGNSGVGKTGLGWRLAHNAFKEHPSTHGQQFWMIDDLCKIREDGTECEAVLWDLAGQHVYRPIHAIFLDNVAASLVLFDPTHRQDPLKGTQFWLEQLKGKKQLPPSILVGARMDRGGSTVPQESLEQFCQQYGISGGYISTSAKTGEGLEALIEQIKAQIPWDEMTTTVTTVTFKRIKDYVLQLKEQPDRQDVLVQPDTLRQQLQATAADWQFTDAEMITAVGHLETHGYVTILTSSAGDTHILLAPDLLVDLASSIVLQADKHPRELGAISEAELLAGEFNFEELAGLAEAERQILLDAAVLRFLEHNICFRETFDTDTLLIFPGLIKQKRPLEDDFPANDDVSYVVRGRVENLYAMLVVLLGYTPSFIRINHWQNQAQYAMGKNEICGFRMVEDRDGEIELVLYYSQSMPAYGRDQFQELFERFLYQREVQVTRFPPVVCPNAHPLERATVISRIRDGRDFAFCAECGERVILPHLDQPSIGIESSDWLRREEAMARLRSTYEQHVTRVKGYRRGWATPRCYLSYVPSEENKAQKIRADLKEAGIYLIEDTIQVQPDDYVVVLDTPAYQQAWQQPSTEFQTDIQLVQARLNGTKLISLKLEDDTVQSHKLEDCLPGKFGNLTHYPVSLFNLVLNLYAIPLTHVSFEPLRQILHQQWEQTLSQLPAPAMIPEKRPLKVFISYAHKDEAFKDELAIMLRSMERNGVIDAWQDRRIEPGEEWYEAIQTAMNECDLAILLVSKSFLASRFITSEEIPKLLQRRKQAGMRVVPVIIRPCMWDSEPVLKDLQALPRDGKAIITFPEDTGERDQVWTDIAKAIEKLAKAKQAETD